MVVQRPPPWPAIEQDDEANAMPNRARSPGPESRAGRNPSFIRRLLGAVSDRPDQSQQRPSPGATQVHECKRRVGTRDQQVDGGMIKNAEGALSRRMLHGMIDGRRSVECDERRTINADADDVPCRAMRHGQHY